MLYQFKIQLKNVSKPPVWRRVLVPETFTFEKFHDVIQEAFGWEFAHLYQFSPAGYGSYPTIMLPSPYDDDKPDKNAEKTKLKDIFTIENQKYTYIYDFGDDWMHSIVLEKIHVDKAKKASCVAGKGKCPPEDCGGPLGYENLLEILKDPKHEDYEEMREWLGLEEGGKWDVNEFDLLYANAMVSQI